MKLQEYGWYEKGTIIIKIVDAIKIIIFCNFRNKDDLLEKLCNRWSVILQAGK